MTFSGSEVIYIWVRLGFYTLRKSQFPIWKSYPKNIISLLNKKTDVIITAGFLEIQKLKVKELWISDYKMIVVDEWRDKIISTIQYIIYDLGFIPSSITIYEDRPEFFVKYSDLLSDILWTKIIVNKVHMISNDINGPYHR